MSKRRTLVLRRAAILLAALMVSGGCSTGPALLPLEKRVPIDRADVERPNGLELTPLIDRLTAPSSIAFARDGTLDGTMFVAEGGLPGTEPRIVGFSPEGKRLDVYPSKANPIARLLAKQPRLYGPITGMAVAGDEIYVAHRDAAGGGMISAYRTDGSRRTVIGQLPAVGDFGLTDLTFHPTNNRLYFGIGAATNSGVVGIDNWQAGWSRKYPTVSDSPAVKLKLLGFRFDTRNPSGGLLGGDDIAVTAPFQPFGMSNRVRVPASPTGKPTAAIFSISSGGGDVRVEAHGLRNPRGLAFNDFGNLFVANQGMELRGTRPVKDDPDAVVRVPPGGGTWYGWPDFSADLVPITDDRFQPPTELIARTGYPEVSFLIDHEGSGLIPPDRQTLVRGVFPSLSGASKMAFVANQPGFEASEGDLLVALAGDRFPLATGGIKLKGPVGYKIVRLDPDNKQIVDFVYNTSLVPPSHRRQATGIERPIDLKFGPDGALYIVDQGPIDYRSGVARSKAAAGRVLRLSPDR
jgi:glucose/arabinose dehydrogenase